MVGLASEQNVSKAKHVCFWVSYRHDCPPSDQESTPQAFDLQKAIQNFDDRRHCDCSFLCHLKLIVVKSLRRRSVQSCTRLTIVKLILLDNRLRSEELEIQVDITRCITRYHLFERLRIDRLALATSESKQLQSAPIMLCLTYRPCHIVAKQHAIRHVARVGPG